MAVLLARREQGGQVIAADGGAGGRTGVFMGWASRAGGSGTARAIHYSAPKRAGVPPASPEKTMTDITLEHYAAYESLKLRRHPGAYWS